MGQVRLCLHQIYIVCMVTVRLTVKMGSVPIVMVRLTVKMGSVPILSVKQPISIDSMINFDRDGDGHGDGMCKMAFIFTTRNGSCGKVMFSQVSVCPPGEWVCLIPGPFRGTSLPLGRYTSSTEI